MEALKKALQILAEKKYAVEYRYQRPSGKSVITQWARSYKEALFIMQEMLAGGWDSGEEKVLAARVLAWDTDRESSPKVIKNWKERPAAMTASLKKATQLLRTAGAITWAKDEENPYFLIGTVGEDDIEFRIDNRPIRNFLRQQGPRTDIYRIDVRTVGQREWAHIEEVYSLEEAKQVAEDYLEASSAPLSSL